MMVLLGYGGWLVMHDRLPLGTGLVVFAGLLEQFSGQVNNVATIVNSRAAVPDRRAPGVRGHGRDGRSAERA